jgi:hypothetical protein
MHLTATNEAMTKASQKSLISLLALIAVTVASPAQAKPCSEVPARVEMAGALRKAGEDRPVHITFRTTAEGVKLAPALVVRYPDEMTIVLQHQFAKLVVKDDRFEVGVWFKRRYERLVVPFDAVKGFWDTEVQRCGEE